METINKSIIRIGLKNNALFLFNQMAGNNLGGTGNHPTKNKNCDIHHSAIIYLNDTQFNDFKNLIVKFGFSIEKSLSEVSLPNCDYSCYLD